MANNQKLTKAYLKELASDIMLELTDNELDGISAIEESLTRRFEKVTSINTDGLEPLFFPFEQPHTYLRDDNDMHANQQSDLLANAPSTDGDYITIVRVVK